MAGKLSLARLRALTSASALTAVSTSGDATVGSGLVLSDVAAANLDAAGSTVSDAAAIVSHVTNVSASVTSRGVKLPAAATSGEVYVISNVGVGNMNLYAPSGETLNGVASVTLSGSTGAVAVKAGSTNWAFVYSKV